MGLLPTTYFPGHAQNRMKSEGDVVGARRRFVEERPGNLHYLLEQRYSWMNPYLEGRAQALAAIDWVDWMLVRLLPEQLALGTRVVLRKIEAAGIRNPAADLSS